MGRSIITVKSFQPIDSNCSRIYSIDVVIVVVDVVSKGVPHLISAGGIPYSCKAGRNGRVVGLLNLMKKQKCADSSSIICEPCV